MQETAATPLISKRINHSFSVASDDKEKALRFVAGFANSDISLPIDMRKVRLKADSEVRSQAPDMPAIPLQELIAGKGHDIGRQEDVGSANRISLFESSSQDQSSSSDHRAEDLGVQGIRLAEICPQITVLVPELS
jgi:hypothetical protein